MPRLTRRLRTVIPTTPEFLFLVNGLDDNGDGYVDNGCDGIDNDGDGYDRPSVIERRLLTGMG